MLHIQLNHRRPGSARYLSPDRDSLFEYHRWQADLLVVEIEEIKTVPYVPLSHPFVERLLGTCCRKNWDRVLFSNAHDLQREFTKFQSYYHEQRVHSSPDGRPPAEVAELARRPKISAHQYRWQSACRGMYEFLIAA